MLFSFGPRIRHPFFPGLNPTPAWEAKGLIPAMYGTFPELVRAANGGAHVRRAVFVTQFQDEPLLNEADRDTLWEMFQAPAFVLLLDRKGRVMAYECEAQSGLHVSPAYTMEADTTEVCECGRPGGKLLLKCIEPVRVA